MKDVLVMGNVLPLKAKIRLLEDRIKRLEDFIREQEKEKDKLRNPERFYPLTLR